MMFYLIFLITIGVSTAAICPKQTQSDVPKYTKQLGNQDMVRLQYSIALLCCAEGYSNISWYKMEGLEWVPWPPEDSGSSTTPTTEENNQVLRINRAEMGDNTSFRCDLIKNEQIVKQHMMQLIVVRCAEMARGPIPTKPFPRNATISKFGDNVTFSCTGFFGCSKSDLRVATWFVKDENNLPVKSDRYVKKQHSWNYDKTIFGSDLTVYDVQPKDLKRTFTCELASPQIFQGTYKTSAWIFKKEPPVKIPIWKLITVTAGSVVGLVVVVILVVTGVNKCYGPRVRWYLNNHLPSCKPLPERGDMEYNALLYHADDDTQKAHDVREKLRDKGLDIFMSHDISGNRFLGEYDNIVKKCLKIIFLYSENLRCDNFAHFLLQSLISSRRDGDIIFLVLNDFCPKNVKECTDSAVNPEEENQSNGFNLPVNGANLNEASQNQNDSARINDIEQDGDADRTKYYKSKDLSFWKSLPRWNVPNIEASDRENKNFTCWLQNKIPKFAEQVEEEKNAKKSRASRKRRTSSGRSLLNSHTDEGIMTPNSPRETMSDSVFNEQDDLNGAFDERLEPKNCTEASIEHVDETKVEDVVPTDLDTGHGNEGSGHHRSNSKNQFYRGLEEQNENGSFQPDAIMNSLLNANENEAKRTNIDDNIDSRGALNNITYDIIEPKNKDFNASGSSGASELMSSQSGSFDQSQNIMQNHFFEKPQEEPDRSTLINRVKLDPISMPERFSSGESGYGDSPEKSLSPDTVNRHFDGLTHR